MLSEVTLERQALGFGFRIVGGTEEGSQVTVGHIVANGGKYNTPYPIHLQCISTDQIHLTRCFYKILIFSG